RLNDIDNHINTLTAQEVEDVDFLALKYEMLVNPPFNIPVGHAVKLLNLIKEIQENISSSSGSMSTSPLLMFIKTVINNLELQAKNSEVIVHFMKEFSRTESKFIDFNPLQGDLAKMHLKGYLGVGSSSSYNPSNEVRALQYLNKDTDSNRLVLVDWGSAIKIMDHNQIYTYEGTITFASTSDDLFLPRVIKEYWNDKLKDHFWAEIVNAVMDKNYNLLMKCCYFVLQNDNTSGKQI
ncbi:13566_t:CDS:2, partial [Gigaspora margarita]